MSSGARLDQATTSAPAEKAFAPEPVMTTTRTSASASIVSKASSSAANIGSVSALSFSGRFSVMVATGPSSETNSV